MIKYLNKSIALMDPRSVIAFLSVGASATLLYFGSFTLLYKYFQLNYKFAVSIAYLLSVILHFTANRRITFQSHGQQLLQQLIKYAVMAGVNYSITLIVMHFIVAILGLSPYFGVLFAIGTTVSSGYLMAKFWVFKKPHLVM